MAEPLARATATDGLGLPLTLGGATLAAMPEAARVMVVPYRGREAAVGAALGGALPPPGALTALGAGRVLWAGLGQWLVEGGEVPDLAELAAVVDQSDAWAGLALSGADAGAVLARLAPVDAAALPPGAVARTMLRHVACLLVATDAGFELLVLRSFAGSAVHDLEEAMRAVAGRAALTAPDAQL